MESPAIGIDLGTTYSCVAVCQEGKVTIIPNELGEKTTPSYIAVDRSGAVVIGDVAKNQANITPENAIFDVKRLIGRSYDDPIVQDDIKMWPFEVINDNNVPKLKLNGKTYYPEQISAKVLSYLRTQAQNYLGCEVRDAVITVPAYFNDGQRQATKDAGAIAGLNVLRIINEPTAAAIAYSHQLNLTGKRTILVFDLGGGTFDIALVSMEGSNVEVIAVGGDTHLGGEDFDNIMAEHCILEFERKNGIRLDEGKNSNDLGTRFRATKFLRRLKNECERQKINLTAAQRVTVSVEAVNGPDMDLIVPFPRRLFNELNMDKFKKCIQTVERVVADAQMNKSQIDDIVLVGGSSKIVCIRDLIKECFPGTNVSQQIKPDEAVAYGAAVLASKIQVGDEGSQPSDVIPLPIGIRIWVQDNDPNDFSVVLDKNKRIPCKETKGFSTPFENCKQLDIRIYEGESKSCAENHLLGQFLLKNLPDNCPKHEVIEVTMDVNAEGILHCTAECPRTQEREEVTVTVEEVKNRIKPEEMVGLQMEVISHLESIVTAMTIYSLILTNKSVFQELFLSSNHVFV